MEKLNQMTNRELGQLFPIFLTEHSPNWQISFEEEKLLINQTFGIVFFLAIDHIGSTAIPSIKAKPTIDILLQVEKATDIQVLIEVFKNLGYHYIPKPENPAPGIMFVKGYSPLGYVGQAFHVHVRFPGVYDEIIFRDYLISHPIDALEYEKLKIALSEKYRFDRDGYTEAKTFFVRKILEKAKGPISKFL